MTNITEIKQQLAELTEKVNALSQTSEDSFVLTKDEMVMLVKHLNSFFLEKLGNAIEQHDFEDHIEIDTEVYNKTIDISLDINTRSIKEEITNFVDFSDCGDDEVLDTVDNILTQSRKNNG